MFEDRADVAEADEDGGGRDEKYEINSMGKSSGTGTTRKVAMVSQHTGTRINKEIWQTLIRLNIFLTGSILD